MAEIKYLSPAGLAKYDAAIKAWVEAKHGELNSAIESVVGDATKGLVKSVKDNADAIALLNGDTSKEGSVDKKIADAIGTDATGLQGRVKANEDAIDVLNSDATTEGSVDKKIADALNTFATEVSDDNTINKIKEIVDYLAGVDASTGAASTIADVAANKTAIGTKNTKGEGEASDATGIYKDIEDLRAGLAAAVAGGVTDVKINGVTIVTNNVANLGTLASKSTVTNDEVADAALDIAKINGLQDALDDKQDAIPANTYDAYGDASAAESNAKSYADNITVNGKVQTAQAITVGAEDIAISDPENKITATTVNAALLEIAGSVAALDTYVAITDDEIDALFAPKAA